MGKFEIPLTPPAVNKTVRFASDVVDGVEKAIQGKDCTFSAVVIAAVRAALANLEEKSSRSLPAPKEGTVFYKTFRKALAHRLLTWYNTGTMQRIGGSPVKKILSVLLFAAMVMALWGCDQPQPPVTTQSTVPSTLPQKGWQTVDGVKYYYTGQGTPITGWLELPEGTFYLDPQAGGAMTTGWIAVDGNRYFLQENGTMATGWVDTPQGKAYLGENGVAVTGWQTLQEKTYYFDGQGILAIGWVETEAGKYYTDPQGVLLSGWQEIDGKRYYFAETGRMHTGWLESDGETYYLKPDGSAARGKLEIDGKTHYFVSSGAQILLVNPWNFLPEGYEVELVQFANANDGKIAASIADALQQMMDGCQAAGYRVRFRSGYRSQAKQELYFNNWRNMLISQGMSFEEATEATKKEVAYPGTSEHQLGLAVDLTDWDYTNLNENQAKTESQKWLMEHCWDYGFILRYPEGSTASTGIIYEPWHYRYVGVELAKEIRDSGLTLEEYLEALTQQENGG